MKKVLCCSLCSLLFFIDPVDAQYQPGEVLQVVARSGLRMRISPQSDAGTIRVLPFGEAVVVTRSAADSNRYEKSGWYDGNWLYVSTSMGSGYVFDAYLSTLEQPTHEDELCYRPFEFTAAVRTYFRNHYPVVREEQGAESNEVIIQRSTVHESGHRMTGTEGEGWYKTEVYLPGHRISEVVCLLRTMMVGDDLVKMYEESLRFYQDAQGKLQKVLAGSEVNPVTIERTDNGVIKLSFIEFVIGDGC